MAEIKSTLDLVMERTRNLTMSEDDRREQSAAEFRAGVNKFLQKYLEGEISADRFQNELQRFARDFPELDPKTAIREIAGRIDPDADNSFLVELLRECGADVSGIERLLKEYAKTADLLDVTASEKILADLRKAGILGSAVVPNLATDEDLETARKEMSESFRKNLAAEIDPRW